MKDDGSGCNLYFSKKTRSTINDASLIVIDVRLQINKTSSNGRYNRQDHVKFTYINLINIIQLLLEIFNKFQIFEVSIVCKRKAFQTCVHQKIEQETDFSLLDKQEEECSRFV